MNNPKLRRINSLILKTKQKVEEEMTKKFNLSIKPTKLEHQISSDIPTPKPKNSVFERGPSMFNTVISPQFK